MAVGLLGRKVGMTQVFDDAGKVIPVTVIQAGPCRVLQIRTLKRDGYEAVQVGYGNKARRLASRSQRGHVARLDSKRSKRLAAGGVELVAKADCEPQQFVREFRGAPADLTVGQELRVALFGEVKAVDVTGISKGRGTAGPMKRHHFSGQRASHGVKKVHRHAGSTGCNTFPARVFKGRRMAGRLGNEQTTNRNLKVVGIDAENDLLLVRGAVPGPNGGYVVVRQTNKLQGAAKKPTR
ncbi:MAG: 50S ribosomal protein L3 [Planctomycetia bacterium]|nr:50S ribosomal protein L3 [Planctomycetia bacterium]